MCCCSSICSGEKNNNVKIVTVNYSNKYTRVIGYTVNNVINMVVVDDKINTFQYHINVVSTIIPVIGY